jgi:hypothetical protein
MITDFCVDLYLNHKFRELVGVLLLQKAFSLFCLPWVAIPELRFAGAGRAPSYPVPRMVARKLCNSSRGVQLVGNPRCRVRALWKSCRPSVMSAALNRLFAACMCCVELSLEEYRFPALRIGTSCLRITLLLLHFVAGLSANVTTSLTTPPCEALQARELWAHSTPSSACLAELHWGQVCATCL